MNGLASQQQKEASVRTTIIRNRLLFGVAAVCLIVRLLFDLGSFTRVINAARLRRLKIWICYLSRNAEPFRQRLCRPPNQNRLSWFTVKNRNAARTRRVNPSHLLLLHILHQSPGVIRLRCILGCCDSGFKHVGCEIE